MFSCDLFLILAVGEAVNFQALFQSKCFHRAHERIADRLESADKGNLIPENLAQKRHDPSQGAEEWDPEVQIQSIKTGKLVSDVSFLQFFDVWHTLIMSPADYRIKHLPFNKAK